MTSSPDNTRRRVTHFNCNNPSHQNRECCDCNPIVGCYFDETSFIKDELLDEVKLKKAMAQSIQDQKKLSPDNTVEERSKLIAILMNLSDDAQGQRYLLERGEISIHQQIDKVWELVKEAKQSLDSHYLSIFLEEIDNELSMPNPLQPVTALFRLKKLRKALQDRLGGKS